MQSCQCYFEYGDIFIILLYEFYGFKFHMDSIVEGLKQSFCKTNTLLNPPFIYAILRHVSRLVKLYQSVKKTPFAPVLYSPIIIIFIIIIIIYYIIYI